MRTRHHLSSKYLRLLWHGIRATQQKSKTLIPTTFRNQKEKIECSSSSLCSPNPTAAITILFRRRCPSSSTQLPTSSTLPPTPLSSSRDYTIVLVAFPLFFFLISKRTTTKVGWLWTLNSSSLSRDLWLSLRRRLHVIAILIFILLSCRLRRLIFVFIFFASYSSLTRLQSMLMWADQVDLSRGAVSSQLEMTMHILELTDPTRPYPSQLSRPKQRSQPEPRSQL